MKKFALSLIAALVVAAVSGGVAAAQGSADESGSAQAAHTWNIWA